MNGYKTRINYTCSLPARDSHFLQHAQTKQRDRRRFFKQVEIKREQQNDTWTEWMEILCKITNKSTHQEYITAINIYAPSCGTVKYIEKILKNVMREIYCNAIIGGP